MPAYIIFLLLINDFRRESKLPCILGIMQTKAEPYLVGLHQFLTWKPDAWGLPCNDVKAFSEWQACCTYLNKKTWQASHFTVISLGHFSKAEDPRQSDFNRPSSVLIPRSAQPEEFDCCLAWELMNNATESSRLHQWHGYSALTATKTVCLHMKLLSPLLNLKLLIPCPQNITSSIKL